jgi:hypothetical protein
MTNVPQYNTFSLRLAEYLGLLLQNMRNKSTPYPNNKCSENATNNTSNLKMVKM